jgi:hypothetical protein
MIEFFFDVIVFGALLCAWNVFLRAGRAERFVEGTAIS